MKVILSEDELKRAIMNWLSDSQHLRNVVDTIGNDPDIKIYSPTSVMVNSSISVPEPYAVVGTD